MQIPVHFGPVAAGQPERSSHPRPMARALAGAMMLGCAWRMQHRITCIVCLEQCGPEDLVAALNDVDSSEPAPCSHLEQTCQACARKYVIGKVSDGRYPIPCPAGELRCAITARWWCLG